MTVYKQTATLCYVMAAATLAVVGMHYHAWPAAIGSALALALTGLGFHAADDIVGRLDNIQFQLRQAENRQNQRQT